MESSGWEVRPAGWILLAVIVLAAIYFISASLGKRPEQNPQKTS